MYVDDEGVLRFAGGTVEDHWTTAKYEEVDGFAVRVAMDECGQDTCDPRDWSNVGTMIVDYRGYNFGEGTPLDVTGRSQHEFNSIEHHVRWIKLTQGAKVVLPLYVLDHSGISMSAGGSLQAYHAQRAHMGMDTSMCGFYYDTPKGVEDCIGKDATLEQIEAALQSEVVDYDTYLRGEVYFWQIIDLATGDDVESCGGYLGYEAAEEAFKEALSYVPHLAAERDKASA